MAGVLAAGTSRRGRLCEELVEAVAQERYGDAASTQIYVDVYMYTHMKVQTCIYAHEYLPKNGFRMQLVRIYMYIYVCIHIHTHLYTDV